MNDLNTVRKEYGMTSELVQRLDGFANLMTKIGTTRDKAEFNEVYDRKVNITEVQNLYNNSKLSQKIVDIYPDEGTREWLSFVSGSPADINKANELLKDLSVKETFREATHLARLYGGCGVLMYDGTGLEAQQEPFQGASPSIARLLPFSSESLKGDRYDLVTDPEDSRFGLPRIYHTHHSTGSFKIDQSRLLFFTGDKVTRARAIEVGYWGYPVLHRLADPIKSWTMSHKYVAGIISDFRTGIFKMKGMIDAMAECATNPDTGEKAAMEKYLQERIDHLSMSLSSIKQIMIDSEDDYTQNTPAVSGLDKLLEAEDKRLVVEADIPHTILLGESPSASNGTGNSTTLDWYNKIHAWQQDNLTKPLQKPLETVGLCVCEFEYEPLWQMTDEQKAKVMLDMANADNVYLANGVVTKDEVRNSRFAKGAFSTETIIDG